ncbi:MAG: hypothetical protein JXB88_00085 [Spirochaetales bacterium]|nr:hypothetical protein [Spirochaetales bacterium]
MRSGEIITLISLTLSVIILLIPPRNRPFVFLLFPVSFPFIFVFHLFMESPRWQMVPAYIFSGVVLIISIIQVRKRKKEMKIFFHNKKKHPKLFLLFTTFFFLVFTILLPVLFPVFKLPLPTGPYKTGTTWEAVLDQTRQESLTDNQDDKRKLALKIWYPSDTSKKTGLDPYWSYPHLLSKYMAEYYHMPSFFFEYLGLVKTNSIIDAEISTEKESYPVILSLHGGNCINYVTDLRVLNEDLASHGFIVIGLTHPYSSLPVVFSDNDIAICPPERRKAIKQQTRLSEIFMSAFFAQQNPDEKELLQKLFTIETIKISEIGRRMEDVHSVLNWLGDVHSGKISSILNGKCNLEALGILGIHMGGSVAVNTFLGEKKIKACVNLDGFHYTDTEDLKIERPYLLITSEASRFYTLKFIRNQLGSGSIMVPVKDSTLKSFTDFSLFSPLIDFFQVNGKAGYKKIFDMIRDLSVSYLENSVSGEKSPDMKSLSEKYSEMIIEM